MVAGDWAATEPAGTAYFSILYTFATTALLALFTHRMSAGDQRLAAVLYLLRSTFRYARVYLTSAPKPSGWRCRALANVVAPAPPGGKRTPAAHGVLSPAVGIAMAWVRPTSPLPWWRHAAAL